jgi:hypothetical protein
MKGRASSLSVASPTGTLVLSEPVRMWRTQPPIAGDAAASASDTGFQVRSSRLLTTNETTLPSSYSRSNSDKQIVIKPVVPASHWSNVLIGPQSKETQTLKYPVHQHSDGDDINNKNNNSNNNNDNDDLSKSLSSMSGYIPGFIRLRKDVAEGQQRQPGVASVGAQRTTTVTHRSVKVLDEMLSYQSIGAGERTAREANDMRVGYNIKKTREFKFGTTDAAKTKIMASKIVRRGGGPVTGAATQTTEDILDSLTSSLAEGSLRAPGMLSGTNAVTTFTTETGDEGGDAVGELKRGPRTSEGVVGNGRQGQSSTLASTMDDNSRPSSRSRGSPPSSAPRTKSAATATAITTTSSAAVTEAQFPPYIIKPNPSKKGIRVIGNDSLSPADPLYSPEKFRRPVFSSGVEAPDSWAAGSLTSKQGSHFEPDCTDSLDGSSAASSPQREAWTPIYGGYEGSNGSNFDIHREASILTPTEVLPMPNKFPTVRPLTGTDNGLVPDFAAIKPGTRPNPNR